MTAATGMRVFDVLVGQQAVIAPAGA